MTNKKYLEYIHSQNLYDFKDKKENIFNHTLYMLIRTGSMFKWSGLPGTIPECFLELYLQVNGFACVAKDPETDELYAFFGGLGGEPDAYYQPTECIVANPYLNLSKSYKIGEDCIIVKNDPFYRGLIPLFNKYASQLAENELSLNMASINTRIQQAIAAGDDRSKESAELFLKKLVEGDIAVLADNAFLDNDSLKTLPFSNTGSSGVIGDLIEYEQYLKASWFNELGLNANYNMKREALNSAESSINDDILFPLVDEMLKLRKDGAARINEMFGTDISVELASSWEDNKEEEEATISDISNVDNVDNPVDNPEDKEDEEEQDDKEPVEAEQETDADDGNEDAEGSDEEDNETEKPGEIDSIKDNIIDTVHEIQEKTEEVIAGVDLMEDEKKEGEDDE